MLYHSMLLYTSGSHTVRARALINPHNPASDYAAVTFVIMRQDRGAKRPRVFFAFRQKSLFIAGRTSMRRVPQIKNKNIFLYQGCVIQHRNWPLRSTIPNTHITNASPDGLCTRTWYHKVLYIRPRVKKSRRRYIS